MNDVIKRLDQQIHELIRIFHAYPQSIEADTKFNNKLQAVEDAVVVLGLAVESLLQSTNAVSPSTKEIEEAIDKLSTTRQDPQKSRLAFRNRHKEN